MLKNDFQLLSASISDLDAINKLLLSVKLPVEGVEDHINHFLILKEPASEQTSDHIIGCIGLEIYQDQALLRSLVVHPRKQKLGLGKLLTNEIISYAKQHGVTKLYLRTDTAESFFQKRGFRLIALEEIPVLVKQSVEFNPSVCSDNATNMVKDL